MHTLKCCAADSTRHSFHDQLPVSVRDTIGVQRKRDGKTLLILFPQGILHAAQELSSLGHKNEVLHLLGNKLPIAISPEFVTEWLFPERFLDSHGISETSGNIEHRAFYTYALSIGYSCDKNISIATLIRMSSLWGRG